MKPYSGIGSRNTPKDILDLMTGAAGELSRLGFTLRSGAAGGADAAFEAGADQAGGTKEIYIPWSGFQDKNPKHQGIYLVEGDKQREAERVAETLHPRWSALSQGARKLMARNCFQVLGAGLNTSSLFVLCWTPDGCERKEDRSSKTGGTGLAIELACEMGVPVINLKNEGAAERLLMIIDNQTVR